MSDERMPVSVRTLEGHGISLEMLAATTDKRLMDGAIQNAHIIAAAQELYEELEDCECPDVTDPGSAQLTVGRCYELGRCDCNRGAALAKARGEQEDT